MIMPVISMYGPWANWVGLGWKTIETRTHNRFKSLAGKRIGIHKTLRWDDGAIDLARPFLDECQIAHTRTFLHLGGAIFWTAFVKEHRELDPLDNKAALIDCTHVTRYGLFLEDVQMIEMIPCNGKQGIWYHEIP
jgi:hypothetical protein